MISHKISQGMAVLAVKTIFKLVNPVESNRQNRLHENEKFWPSSVEWFANRSKLVDEDGQEIPFDTTNSNLWGVNLVGFR